MDATSTGGWAGRRRTRRRAVLGGLLAVGLGGLVGARLLRSHLG